MIVLYGSHPGFGLPEVSPYVTKTEVQFKMAGVAYRKQPAAPNQSPKGQVPFIDDGGDIIADSTFIRAHIERKFGIDLDDGLTSLQRAQAWAFERMLENQFGWAMAHARWIISENFEKGPAHFFDAAPPEMREQMRADVRVRVADSLRANGVGRHTPEEILMLADRSLQALSELSGDKPFLFGDRPAGVDATAFALLAAVMTPFFNSPLHKRACEYPSLVAYVDRIMQLYYPEHPWALRSGAHVEQVG
ncbi:protein C6orf168 [alpha proteobacterium U9-1i]|nr:protein C6orf168 [alpha proteobacterium U9-1i]